MPCKLGNATLVCKLGEYDRRRFEKLERNTPVAQKVQAKPKRGFN